MSQPLHIRGTQVWNLEETAQRDLSIENGRIVAEKPNDALVIDLEGYTLFPGLINAHDHLELNHYPRTKFRDVYDNAHQWGEDLNARLNEEPFQSLRSVPLWDRLFIGGLKNLLCGATTVAHHGPKYPEMYRRDFPIRVLKNYGWAHSLHFNTEAEIIRSYRSTPKDWPWFIHLAEGTDEIATGEYQRLKKLGCVGQNTVIVHGVGMSEEDLADAANTVRGLVICPSTNRYLLGITLNASSLKVEPASLHLAIGSDSRLTATGNWWDELEAFASYTGVNRRVLTGVSQGGAKIVGASAPSADYCILEMRNDSVTRQCLAAVMRDGIPQIGDPELMAKFPHIQTIACTLDGVEKRMNVRLARQVHRCTLKEPGLEVDELPNAKRFIFF